MLHKTVLVVEDNPEDARAIIVGMSRYVGAADVVAVSSGEQAVALLTQNPESEEVFRPSLVMLDLSMPTTSGLDVLHSLKADARTATVPVVIFTGSEDVQNIKQAYAEGVNAYVLKPHDHREFVERIWRTAQFWLTRNEVPPR